MKTLYRLFGTGRQRLIVHQIIFPQILERSSHLFQIVNLGPPFIGRALALCHALLNVYNQIDTTGRSRGLLRELRDRTIPGNHSPDVLGIKTIPEGGCPQAGRLILSGSKKGDHTATAMLYQKAGLLHEPQKRRKIGGLFLQSLHDGQPHPLFCRGRLFPNPLAIMEIPALAVLFWILDHREVMLNAHPVREPPQGKAGADKIMELPRAVKGR